MEQRLLGTSGIKVSALCLGTMTWGEQNTQDEGFAQMDYALERGVNFWDTAELYPVPPDPAKQGRTEEIIGNWFASRPGKRAEVILATKVKGPTGSLQPQLKEQRSLSRHTITTALDASLKRLKTDVIDLYQIHWPDRTTNYFGRLGYTHHEEDSVPIRETLSALHDAVKAGKVRTVGISNETPWGLKEYLRLASDEGLPRVVSIQNPYNLLNRSFEVGLSEMAIRDSVGLLAYSPLAFGMLSGKYGAQPWPAKGRLTLFKRFSRYTGARAVAATEQYVALARQHGLDQAQMALAFVTQQPFVTSNIIGATTLEQLKTNIDSADITLSAEVLAGIEAIHQDNPNPAP
ncbi:MAG: NADP(H)-dependent aldo-keto reductase [Alphaproteobacteria bacterium]|jgi:aryl-alcohol dehydrogenase-like predicted oxidoreductase|nr:NADP(H)-dependent aldo-keto reductase [Alphaproteobacteria bacterium]